MNKLFRFLFDKEYRFLIMADRGCYKWMSDEEFICRKFKAQNHIELSLDNPTNYNEKLQWLKLHDHNPRYIEMVDKVQAKQFIASKIGEDYIIPTIGVYSNTDEINFEALPEQFVIKCSHASGANIICKGKNNLDVKKAKKQLNKWLKKNWFWYGREWPYLECPHRIIIEEFMVDKNDETGDSATTDYKFFCFNGVPKVMYISKDRSEDPRTDFFDMDYKHLPIKMKDPNADVLPQKPILFDQMKELAAKLSKGVPHLRVDFYVFNGKVYVGELTFYHCSGFSVLKPDEWNAKMGDWIDLSPFLGGV